MFHLRLGGKLSPAPKNLMFEFSIMYVTVWGRGQQPTAHGLGPACRHGVWWWWALGALPSCAATQGKWWQCLGLSVTARLPRT